jgi:integrase
VSKYHPENERIKREYFSFLKEAKRQSVETVDAVAQALARFEADTQYRDFRTFRREQAIAFKRRLADRESRATGEKLSKATQHAMLAHTKRFFQWLALQPGYKSKIEYTDSEYLNLSEKDTRVATARRPQRVPTLEQVRHVILAMPASSEIEQRDRALIAFALLTGARDSALATMRLGHVDLAARSVLQDARTVKTKFSKTFTTYFFPVGDDVRAMFEAWVGYLRDVRLLGNDDPLFPATRVELGSALQFRAAGLDRVGWSTAAPVRAIFKRGFESAGLPYYNPHSLRKTIVQLGEQVCRTPEEFKAWSQNLGHEGVLTTFASYGQVALGRQGDLIKALGRPAVDRLPNASAEMIDAAAQFLQRLGMKVHAA